MPAEESASTSPTPDPEPQTADDFIGRGWILHVQGDNPGAEEKFRQAIAKDPQTAEGYYGLGLSLKIQRRQSDAVQAFEQAVQVIQSGKMSDNHVRATMLRHLANWHIKTIKNNMGQEQAP